MDRVDDTVLREKPKLIAPLVRVAVLVHGVVIIDKVLIEDVVCEGWMEGRVHQEIWETHRGKAVVPNGCQVCSPAVEFADPVDLNTRMKKEAVVIASRG